MTTQQHPAQFDWATELLDAEGHVTLSAKEANEIGARLRSMGEKLKAYEDLDEAASDVQLLRMGYAAARLEIESLRARGVAPAMGYEHQCAIMEDERRASLDAFDPDASLTRTEERLYETAFTNGWDRAMRAAQPAGEYPALPEPFCNAHSDADSEWPDMYSASQMRAYVDADRAARAPADSVLEDAARLDWLDEDAGNHVTRVGKTWYTRPTYGHPYRKHKNLRAAIDADRAEQEGK